ncbi:MAG: patatin-like phospholipase family protein [Actinomycetota bacterium]|nr:patatin-like phospholipase family protein [Actinomycetota bacterium]
MADERQFADLVFEGGGVKGIGLAGAFAAIEQRGFTPQGVAGTSAGAITAALVAAGYSSAELDNIVRTMPFGQFKDEGPEDKVPLIGRGASVLLERGIYEGKFFQRWIADLLEAKGVTTFGQLADETAGNPKSRHRLQVIVSDVTHRRMLILPDDAEHLGIDPDELDIAYAVRMSMSIPIFFEPVVHSNRRTGEEHLIVDGGMLSNFPVWLFDREGQEPRWPTFGLLLVEPDPKKPIGHRLAGEAHGAKLGSLVDYIKSLAQTMMEAHDRLYLEKATYARTIPIPTLGVGTTEFDISPERSDALHESGRQAASDFLDHWDFPAYVQEFRRGKQHSRRAELVDSLAR